MIKPAAKVILHDLAELKQSLKSWVDYEWTVSLREDVID